MGRTEGSTTPSIRAAAGEPSGKPVLEYGYAVPLEEDWSDPGRWKLRVYADGSVFWYSKARGRYERAALAPAELAALIDRSSTLLDSARRLSTIDDGHGVYELTVTDGSGRSRSLMDFICDPSDANSVQITHDCPPANRELTVLVRKLFEDTARRGQAWHPTRVRLFARCVNRDGCFVSPRKPSVAWPDFVTVSPLLLVEPQEGPNAGATYDGAEAARLLSVLEKTTTPYPERSDALCEDSRYCQEPSPFMSAEVVVFLLPNGMTVSMFWRPAIPGVE